MSHPHESKRASSADELDTRRKAERHATNAPLRVTLNTAQFAGRADNLSENGVYLFSADRLRVTVELDTDAGPVTYQGKLVRVQQMNAEETGFAIEFERP